MGVAFVGKGLAVVGATPSAVGVVTPAAFISVAPVAATYRILAESGVSLTTENLRYLRTENNG